ncbi:hypothetical protein LJK88_08560 [Paenibacillus sp. P26]|nr:hypothetical protein LJK88_08560 [Paenibacillus sp. P26]
MFKKLLSTMGISLLLLSLPVVASAPKYPAITTQQTTTIAVISYLISIVGTLYPNHIILGVVTTELINGLTMDGMDGKSKPESAVPVPCQ